PSKPASVLPSTLPSNRESSKETIEKEKEKEEEKGEGRLPSALGSRSSPSLTGPSLFKLLIDTFPQAFAKEPDSREATQLRDLGEEISSAGGATAEQVYDAFKEAATHNKLHVSYVRKVLHAWLGIDRAPPK
ncbi:unnamed protein product, partial [marine sediment metagenome]